MFIPRQKPTTIILRRSFETREGVFTPGHRFERLPESINDHVHGVITLRDDEGRHITVTPYELERLT